jgi:hypothetical protein
VRNAVFIRIRHICPVNFYQENSSFSLSFYHAEQKAASLGGLAVFGISWVVK